MSRISTIGKYLDQPLLVSQFSKAMPKLLVTAGIGYGIKNVLNTPKEEKKNAIIKNASVLGFTIASALISTRGLRPLKLFKKQIFKGFNGLSDLKLPQEVRQFQSKLVEAFLQKNKVADDISDVLNKAKSKMLKYSEIKILHDQVKKSSSFGKFFNDLIPEPNFKTSKDIFSEIGRLSLMGLVPVVGGITGGIIGDRLTDANWKEKVPNKIKEGSYQYLANIFLCNLGAGGALWAMEKAKVGSKSVRAAGMIAGILVTGVIGGSFIANYISKKFINPLLDKNKNMQKSDKKIYSERRPEALDIGLHLDDVATVAVMSGLRWIEPALPILYSISGYRAGIGYRNGDKTVAHMNHHQPHRIEDNQEHKNVKMHRHNHALSQKILVQDEKPEVFVKAFG